MSGLTLFRRNRQSTSLIMAPSMDLIEPDTGPKIPEMVEIKCELSPEQLEKYIQSIDHTKYLYNKILIESLRHLLVSLGSKQYTDQDIKSFRNKMIAYLRKKERKKLWIHENENGYEDYKSFLPPRIVNRVTEIKDKFVNPSKLFFHIISFRGYYEYSGVSIREKMDKFFLKVGILNSDSEQYIIIDAWRGPTFSDEEAKI